MAHDLPKILSDEEFAALLKQRKQLDRTAHDHWDNAGVRPPQKPTDGLPESTLEQQFPHIAQKLCAVWPSEACALLINNLVVNSNRDSRQGFPEEIIEDLLMLAAINEMLVRKIEFAPPPKSF